MSEEPKGKGLSAEDEKQKSSEVETEIESKGEQGSKSAAGSKRKKGKMKTKVDSEKKGKKKSAVTHPKTLDMVIEALEALKDSNGSSVYAIQAYILSTYKTVRPDMLNHMLKQAFGQGLASGVLLRPKTQSETSILNGSYKLGNKKALSADDDEETTKEEADSKPDAERKPKKMKGKGKKKSPVTHPRTIDMVTEALEALRDVKGSSVYAIKAYILSTFKTVRPDMLNHMLKQGFNHGLASGAIVRPKAQSDSSVLSGSYKLGSDKMADRGTRSRRKKPASKKSKKAASPKKSVKKSAKKAGKK